MIRKKLASILLGLFTALPSSTRAENVKTQGSGEQKQTESKSEKTPQSKLKQPKYDDTLTLSMGYGFNWKQSKAELQNHYFPFSAGYKLNNNIRLSAVGSANLARRKETDENGNASRSGFEGISIGPQIDLTYSKFKLSLGAEFTNKDLLVFETSDKKVSSTSVELKGAANLKKDLAVIAGVSGLTTDDVDAEMFKFYSGINKRLNKTTNVYTAVAHTRDSNIYNNIITYGVLGFSEKTDSSTINIQGYGGQKLGGKLELENRLRPDISLKLGLEGSFVNDVSKVKEFDAYLALVFH